jgi:hypothetical protein
MTQWLQQMIAMAVLVTSVAAQNVTYDTFMQLPPDQRRAQFQTLTAEQKAELVRTHVQRYLAKHRSSLTLDQVAFLEENVRTISPDNYRHPISPELREKRDDIDKRARALFTRGEGRQIFTIDGDYIPPAQ